MTAKHRDPLYLANARIVRAQVKRAWRFGGDVDCWRCGRGIMPGSRFDVGHLDADGGHALANLAAEHVRCNRSAGGRAGAAITNAMRGARPATPRATTSTSTSSSSRRFAPW